MSFGKKNLGVVLLAAVFFSALGAAPAMGFNYELLEAIPLVGNSGDSPNLTALIIGIYKLSLWVVGIAALFMLSVGAFYYMSSAGNTATAGTAKKIITDSLLGLLMALVAWGMLYVINPDLVQNGVANVSLFKVGVRDKNGNLPTRVLETVRQSEDGNFQSVSNPGTGSDPAIKEANYHLYGCADKTADTHIPCAKCDSCATINCTAGPCSVSNDVKSKINAAAAGGSVIEGWPPKTESTDACIKNGTCVKINVGTDVATVVDAYKKLKAQGLNVQYVSKGSCSPYVETIVLGSVTTTRQINCTTNPTIPASYLIVS